MKQQPQPPRPLGRPKYDPIGSALLIVIGTIIAVLLVLGALGVWSALGALIN